MKKLLCAAAILLFVGAGCPMMSTPPAPTPTPTPTPAPEPIPGPGPHSPQAKAGVIVVDNVGPGDAVTSPLTITGKAKGWYFEASFPVKLLDGQGNVLASGPAQAQGDW